MSELRLRSVISVITLLPLHAGARASPRVGVHARARTRALARAGAGAAATKIEKKRKVKIYSERKGFLSMSKRIVGAISD